MAKRIVITVIGGGSVNWMPGLMKDIYMMDEVDGGDIRLVDPNEDHVKAVAELLKTFNRMRNKSYKISIVDDYSEALSGSDFVLTTFSPGAMDAFYNDLEIPIKYGIRQPVSMTVGPSGISASLRTVPVAYQLVKDMEKLCPNAWLLNVTNPMSTVTKAMNMAAERVKVIGMCHEAHSLPEFLGPILGLYKPEGMNINQYLYEWLKSQGFDYSIAGVNHFIWLTKANLNGENVLPKIRNFCKNNKEIKSDNESIQATSVFHSNHAAKLSMCRHFGYLPLAGDRHLIEFYPNLCNIRNGYGMKYGVMKTTVDFRRLNKVNQLKDIWEIVRGEKDVKWKSSGEEMTSIMRAIINNTSTKAIVNMPNRGQIANMPRDVIVETLADVNSNGIIPKLSGDLPSSVGSLCRLHSDIHELTVRAALEGSRELFVEALSLDPLSASTDFSELPLLAEELLEANKKWLPRFF